MRTPRSLVAVVALLLSAAPASVQGQTASPEKNLVSAQDVRVACSNAKVRRRKAANMDTVANTDLRMMLHLCYGLRMPVNLRDLTIGDTARIGAAIKAVPKAATVLSYATETRAFDSTIAQVLGDSVRAHLGTLIGSDGFTANDAQRLSDFGGKLAAFLGKFPEEIVQIKATDTVATDSIMNDGRLRTVQQRLKEIREALVFKGVAVTQLQTVICPRYRSLSTLSSYTRAIVDSNTALCAAGDVNLKITPSDSQQYAQKLELRLPAVRARVRNQEIVGAGVATPDVPFHAGNFSAPVVSGAVVDAVLFQVRSELEADLLVAAIKHLCGLNLGLDKVNAFAPRTCHLNADVALTPLTMRAVRATARADLRDAPVRFAQLSLRDGTVLSSTNGHAGELLALAYSLRALSSGVHSPWDYLERFPVWMKELGVEQRFTTSPMARSLYAVSGFARTFREDSNTVRLDRDSLVTELGDRIENTIKAYAVMLLDPSSSPRWKQSGMKLQSSAAVARLYANVVTIAKVAPTIDSLLHGTKRSDADAFTGLIEVADMLIAALAAGSEDGDSTIVRAQEIATRALELHQLARTNRWREMLVRLDELGDTLNLSFSPNWRRVVGLAVDMAEAEDDGDVNAAVRSFVQQGKGYRGKRTPVVESFGRRYWQVNSYVSYVAAYELRKPQGSRWKQWQAAPYLPVGFELGRRPPKSAAVRPARSWSYGGFFQVADLGSIGAARLTSDSSVANNATYAQLFSPGLHFVWSWRGSPLSGSIGFVHARQAYQNSLGRRPATRLQIMAAGFDVPLFP